MIVYKHEHAMEQDWFQVIRFNKAEDFIWQYISSKSTIWLLFKLQVTKSHSGIKNMFF